MYRCEKCGAFNRVPENRPTGAPVCGKCQQALELSGAPQNVDAGQYARAIASSPVPVLVDFWAPWCGPCRASAPMIEQLGKANAGKLVVLKVNTDEHPEPSSALGVQGIPTFVLFRGGTELSRRAGALPGPAMQQWVSASVVG